MKRHPCSEFLRRHRYELLVGLAFALSIGLRVVLAGTAEWIPRSDTGDYHQLAWNLLHGKGYGLTAYQHTPFPGVAFRTARPPGYPLLLAALYKAFGFNPRWAYAANVLFDTATLFFAFLLARRFFGRAAALVAVSLCGLDVVWTPSLMTESAFTCFLMAGTYLLVVGRDFTRPGLNLLLGVVVAGAVMLRPIGIVLAGAAGLLMLTRFSWRMLPRYALTFVPLAVYLALWILRNYGLYGHVFLTTNLGPHLSPSFGIDPGAEFQALKQSLGHVPDEYQLNARLTHEIAARVADHPLLGFRVWWSHLWGIASLAPVWELKGWLWVVTFREHPAIGAVYKALYLPLFVIYPLGGFGMVLLWRRSWRMLLPFALFLLLHPFVSPGNVRFSAPFVPVLAVYCGGLLAALTALLRQKRLDAQGLTRR